MTQVVATGSEVVAAIGARHATSCAGREPSRAMHRELASALGSGASIGALVLHALAAAPAGNAG